MSVSVNIESITPTRAAHFLGFNTDNRRVRPQRVKHYAEQIRNGTWHVTGDTIKFDKNGRLIDGQHRLLAIVEADTTVEAAIVRGLEPGAVRGIDQNSVRSYSDYLTSELGGEASEMRLLASAGHWVRTLEFPGMEFTNLYDARYNDMDTMLSHVAAHPRLANSVQYVNTLGRVGRGLPAKSVMAALHYLFVQKDPILADAFIKGVLTGEMLTVLDPRGLTLRVRNQMLAGKAKEERIGFRTKAALLVKVWNALRGVGRIGELIAFKNRGKCAEPFPTIK